MATRIRRFFGPYRGVVVDNDDPMGLMRLKVQVPAVPGERDSGWALPCVAPGESRVPDIGAPVWIEFEGGDPAHPVWIGTAGKPGGS